MNTREGMSMVITCFNREKYIEEALLSCFNQEYQGLIQYIIVDDASTDNSLTIIENTVKAYGKGLDISIIKLTSNHGVAYATDSGCALAKYDWIHIIDSDDVQLPCRCQYTKEVATKYPNALQIAFCMHTMNQNGQLIGTASYSKNESVANTPSETILNTPIANFENFFNKHTRPGVRCLGAALIFSKKLYDLWGPLCQGETANLRFEQDSTLAFRASLLSNVIGINKLILKYRTHDSNLSNISLPKGYKGVLKNELFQDEYQKFHADSLRCMIRDIRMAMQRQELTNWSNKMLQNAEDILIRRLAGCEMRHQWWRISWSERIKRALHYRTKISKGDKIWLRLLPLHVFCFLKFLKNKF